VKSYLSEVFCIDYVKLQIQTFDLNQATVSF